MYLLASKHSDNREIMPIVFDIYASHSIKEKSIDIMKITTLLTLLHS